jgi:hypothetical protein
MYERNTSNLGMIFMIVLPKLFHYQSSLRMIYFLIYDRIYDSYPTIHPLFSHVFPTESSAAAEVRFLPPTIAW